MITKRRKEKACVIVLLMCIVWLAGPESVTAEAGMKVERVPLDRGVALHLTYCMTQTRDGFLWFGTMYGLVRYDGHSYLNFRHDPADSFSLSNDDIVSLCEDREGDLWVGTYGGGTNRFDRSTGRFERILDKGRETDLVGGVVWAIREDPAGRMWFATQGNGIIMLDRVAGETRRFTHRPDDALSISSNHVTGFDIDGNGQVWAATQRGLNRIDPASGNVSRLDLGKINDATIVPQTLLIDRKENIWVGTAGHGIVLFDPQAIESDGRVRYLAVAGGSLGVNVLVEDNDGRVYAGTSSGVITLEHDGSVRASYRHDPRNRNSLYRDAVVSLCMDQGGILWVGSYIGGISRIFPPSARFTDYFSDSPGNPEDQALALLDFDTSGVLVSTSQGLFRIDPARNSISPVSLPDQLSPGARMIRSMHKDRQGRIWFGTDAGLLHMNARFEVVHLYSYDPNDSTSISSNRVLNILEDRRGNIWAGTVRGLNRLIPGTARFERYLVDSMGLKNDFILSLFEDRDENLWIGTYGGIAVLDADRRIMRHHTQNSEAVGGLSNNYAHAFWQSNDGSLWIGTGGGLNRFNYDLGTFTHYLPRHGLPNGVITGILDGGDGVLWLGTHYGISRFDAKTGSFSNYDEWDGLPCNMFLSGVSSKTGNGYLLFGGLEALVAFLPSEIGVSQFAPPMALTGFTVKDQGPSHTALGNRDVVSLPYSQNHISLEFAALDYMQPSKNLYSYMLEGVDDGWITGSSRIATYTDLDPGEYFFRVKGTNGNGVWGNKESTLRLQVLPPFWQTWWFRAFVLTALVSALFLAHRARLRYRINRLHEMEHARQEAAEAIRKKAARDFHDELGHRLTKIGLFAELIKRRLGSSSPDAAAHVEKIIQASQGLTDDTRNFLWSLDPARDSLYDLVVYVNAFGEELFERTGITFQPAGLSTDMKEVRLTMDFRRHLALIVKEAMNNALRHSGCSNISFSAHVKDGNLRLILSDDGRGYESVPIGKGNGMRNMRMRAEQIKGDIAIESQPGHGTSVSFASVAA